MLEVLDVSKKVIKRFKNDMHGINNESVYQIDIQLENLSEIMFVLVVIIFPVVTKFI